MTTCPWANLTVSCKKAPPLQKRLERRGLMSGGLDLNQRPLAPQAKSGPPAGVAPPGSASQAPDNADDREVAGSDALAPDGRDGTAFAAPVLRDSQSRSLLTVAEVARRLGVCKATVYRICAEGRLAHVRISNAIRVPGEALVAYLHSARS